MRNIFLATIFWLTGAITASAFDIETENSYGPENGQPLEIISSADINIFEPLIMAYLARNPDTRIRYVVTNTQDLYSAISNDEAAFDLAISSAMDLQIKLANDGHALAYRSARTDALPPWARWRNLLFAFAQEPVVVALSLPAMDGLALPQSREDLLQLLRDHPDRFSGRIGTYDPERSGAGYLFATQDARQSDTFWRLAEVFGRVSPQLYTTTGAMISDLRTGKLAIAYNLLGSYVSENLTSWPDGRIIELKDFTHVLLRTALIPATGKNTQTGGRFLDFLLSPEGQTVLAEETGLPPIDEENLARQPHLRPIRLTPGLLVYVDPLKRRRFLNEWRAAVIQN